MTDMESIFQKYEKFIWIAAGAGLGAIGLLIYIMMRGMG